jgi:hypothetical protein
MEPNLSQALHMLNGRTANERVEQGGVINKLLKEEKKTPEQVIEALYVRTLTRMPTTDEMSKLTQALPPKPADTKQEAPYQQEVSKVLNDVFWALLNSNEFMFNH